MSDAKGVVVKVWSDPASNMVNVAMVEERGGRLYAAEHGPIKWREVKRGSAIPHLAFAQEVVIGIRDGLAKETYHNYQSPRDRLLEVSLQCKSDHLADLQKVVDHFVREVRG